MAQDSPFKNEAELKAQIALELEELGFICWLDKRDVPQPERFRYFHGSRKKPDIIVLHNSSLKDISNPFGLEVKYVDNYSSGVNKVIEQMREYKQAPEYSFNGHKVKLNSIFLITQSAYLYNEIYSGSDHFPQTKTPDAKYGIEWAIVRQLFSLTKEESKLYFGILKKSDNYYIRQPNYDFILLKGGMFKRIMNPGMRW